MTETQFSTVETYLENFKDNLQYLPNIKDLESSIGDLWQKLDEQNKLLEKLLDRLNDRPFQ